MTIKTKSWQKNSFGLFDFECKELETSNVRHQGTGTLIREEKPTISGDKRKVKIDIKAIEEEFEDKLRKSSPRCTNMAKILQQGDGYWIYHKNKVDLKSMFSQPEEKLWIVVKEYNGLLDPTYDSDLGDDKKGFKLEKNSVIKMGRVRLRVRDIDYGD